MAFDRRLQVLVDEERFRRLQERSKETGASIGTLVRRAIDETYPSLSDLERRRAAGRRFLAAEPMPVEDWDVMKAQMLDEMSALPDE